MRYDLGRTRAIGLVVTIAFLATIVARVDLNQVGQALGSANYRYVAPALVAVATSYFLRTARWQRILAPTRMIPLRALFPVLMIGFMANNVLPARIGELVRAYSLGRSEGISKSLGLATIMLERLCDGLTLVLFLALVSFTFPLPALSTNGAALSLGMEAAYIVGGVFLLGTLGVLLLLVREDLTVRVLGIVGSRFPQRIGGLLEEKGQLFLQGLHAVRRARAILWIGALSVAVWSVETLIYFNVIQAFNLGLSLQRTLLAALVMLVVVNLGIILPSAPGYVGTFQFFTIAALRLFGVTAEIALSISLVAHAVQYVYVTGIGLLFFTRQNLSLRALVAPTEASPTTDAV
ncbi:MAG: flippase-like domain-containing protein [Chloroflexi bacterium]|nr:flippase-like domain-containing protein [Chloroflexota bacterium]